MAQRRSPSPRGKSAGKTSKAKPKAVKKRAKVKARPTLKSAASKSKAAPKRAAKTKARKPPKVSKARARAAKPAKPSAAKTPIPGSRQSRSPVERRRQRGPKGRRSPAFERAPALGAETRDDDYAYERDTRDIPRAVGEANDAYAPDDLVPGQVGAARSARSNGGSRAAARPRDSETESVTAETTAEAVRSPKGGFDEGDGGQRESEIAGAQRGDGADKGKQDYGRPKTSDGKPGE
ncbi:MAG: hypothetical protein ACYCZX_06005 [Rhodospirillaceae bacterium]